MISSEVQGIRLRAKFPKSKEWMMGAAADADAAVETLRRRVKIVCFYFGCGVLMCFCLYLFPDLFCFCPCLFWVCCVWFCCC